jgi:hypothetical protein
MSRRDRPPRARKSRNSQAPQVDGSASVAPTPEAPPEAEPRPSQVPVDEMAALDAGWDELFL